MIEILGIKDWLAVYSEKQFEIIRSSFGGHAKRLSDGKIFIVGEEVLSLSKNSLIICRIQYFVPGGKFVNIASGSLRISVPINSLQKMPYTEF